MISKKTNNKQKIALGMSGGVDSSLCAHLLKEQGYDVTGVYLECWRAPGCRSEEDRKDALEVALSLDIPFRVLDFKQAYKDKVVEYFFSEYQKGRTPNPDVLCNSEIKFGLFYDWAIEEGFDYVATGHYARISDDKNPMLLTPADRHKDQTYFLHQLSQEYLAHISFPLGDLTKDQVRAEAKKRGIHVADKKDSVGICFIGDIDVTKFLKDRLGENPGEVIDVEGNIIGRHKGLWFYTIGQRHGFNIDKKTLIKQSDKKQIERENFPPFYVIAKKPEKNLLKVGFGADTYQQTFIVNQMQFIGEAQEPNLVRIRHTGKLLECQVKKIKNKTFKVILQEPVRGIAQGQFAVFYQKKLTTKNKDSNTYQCLGGGVISGND